MKSWGTRNPCGRCALLIDNFNPYFQYFSTLSRPFRQRPKSDFCWQSARHNARAEGLQCDSWRPRKPEVVFLWRPVRPKQFHDPIDTTGCGLAGRREIILHPPRNSRLEKEGMSNISTGGNDPCPCGGGKKYKECCPGEEVQSHHRSC